MPLKPRKNKINIFTRPPYETNLKQVAIYFFLNLMLWTKECSCAVPHHVGGIYSGPTVIGIDVKVKTKGTNLRF